MLKYLLSIVLLIHAVYAYGPLNASGSMNGSIRDKETLQPIPGATIQIKGTTFGQVTDSEGKYSFKELEPGTYSVVFSCIGFKTITKADVVIRPDRNTVIDVEMFLETIGTGDVVITGGYFSETEDKPISAANFSFEEVRRSPGTAGDISRVLFNLPSVAKVNDQRNSLIVRGGSPVENSYFIDNIEVPNINHFPVQGSSDGPIGLLNLYYVKDVTFYSGAFSALYGDKLSSIMDIKFREGNHERTEPQVQLSMAGFGASVEGPAGENASYMVSASKSYLDLIMDAAQTGGALPKYGDVQGKFVWNIDKDNKLSFLNILSLDYIDMSYDNTLKAEANVYGYSKGGSNTTGLNWQHLWGNRGYTNNSVSWIYNRYDRNYHETKSKNHLLKNISVENEITIRSVTMCRLSENHSIDFGLDTKLLINSFDMLFEKWQDAYGNFAPALKMDKSLNEYKAALFLTDHIEVSNLLKIDAGIRSDYFSYTGKFSFSPRAAMTVNLDPVTTISAGAGIFYQNIPASILAQNTAFKDLNVPCAKHYVLGFGRMLTESTKLSLELYYKDYTNFPIDPSQPKEFLFDQVIQTGLFLNHSVLSDNGRAFTRGIELLVQKKLARDFYGLASASISKARYKDFEGTWHDRIYDNRLSFTIEGGYIPNNTWEFSLRWCFAGGIPYTPFDNKISTHNNKGIYDLGRVNEARLPDYHSLNVQIVKRFNFERSNLVAYLSIWNAYGRKNIAAINWNEVKNKESEMLQWSALPVIGMQFEF